MEAITQYGSTSDTRWTLPPNLRATALGQVEALCQKAMEHDFHAPGLSGGSDIAALVLAASSVAFDAPDYAGRASELIDHALARINLDNTALFGGATGLVWTALQIDALLGMDEYAALAEDYDAMLYEQVAQPATWHGHFELIYGLTGIGAYALARLKDGHDSGVIPHILRHLEAMATRTADGVHWVTTRDMVPADWWNGGAAHAFVDLGTAHGSAGVIGWLSEVVEQGTWADSARPLLRDALAWFEKAGSGEPDSGVYGYRIGQVDASRGGWCYGDFSAASTFLGAGRALEDATLDATGLTLLRQVVRRSTDSLQVGDPWLCHGYAGLAHIARRAARLHEDVQLLTAAQNYYELALTHDLSITVPPQRLWQFLEGQAGNCLCYLDACGLMRHRWDARLLCI
jgi:hypothetical protein